MKDPRILPQDRIKTDDCLTCEYKRRVGSKWRGTKLKSGGKCCFVGSCPKRENNP